MIYSRVRGSQGQPETVVTNRPVGLVAGLRSLALTACLYDLITRGGWAMPTQTQAIWVNPCQDVVVPRG